MTVFSCNDQSGSNDMQGLQICNFYLNLQFLPSSLKAVLPSEQGSRAPLPIPIC